MCSFTTLFISPENLMGEVALLRPSILSRLPPAARRSSTIARAGGTSTAQALLGSFSLNFLYPCSRLCSSSGRLAPVRSRANGRGANDAGVDDPAFFDEAGAVKDMDRYLNHLSLEYESVWDTKPSWCQPWTILLTGATVSACSWLFLRSLLVTGVVSSLIGIWWYYFLYIYPKAYSDMIAERRKNVRFGVEDTFGQKKNQ